MIIKFNKTWNFDKFSKFPTKHETKCDTNSNPAFWNASSIFSLFLAIFFSLALSLFVSLFFPFYKQDTESGKGYDLFFVAFSFYNLDCPMIKCDTAHLALLARRRLTFLATIHLSRSIFIMFIFSWRGNQSFKIKLWKKSHAFYLLL